VRLEDDGGVRLAFLAPEAESPGGESFGHEPEALAVVHENAHHLAGAGSKDEDSAAEGILEQDLATGGDGTVDTPPEIEGTAGDEDPHVRDDLQHRALPTGPLEVG
jgi:hypothetical protein